MDSVAILVADIRLSLSQNASVATSFLDITATYDNFLLNPQATLYICNAFVLNSSPKDLG